MAPQKLTKYVVEAITPEASDTIKVYDTEIPGFHLKVSPAGRKTFAFWYRSKTKRTATVTLGLFPTMSVAIARETANRLRLEVLKGGDPARELSQHRKAISVGELCERYLSEYVAHRNKASTAAEFSRLVERNIKPSLGSLKVPNITRADIARFHQGMASAPRSANLALSILSKMFNLSELWGIRPDGTNPTRGVPRYPEVRRERFLADSELGLLGATLSRYEAECRLSLQVSSLIRFLALTGLRLSEARLMRWGHVDFREGEIRLPDSKTGARHHVVGAVALALLSGLPRAGEQDFIFHSGNPNSPVSVSTVENAWRRVRNASGLQNIRLHDLRHGVGTFASQAGANAFLIRDKLGHKTLAMTNRYVNRSDAPIRGLSDRIEARISAALEAPNSNAETSITLLRTVAS